MKKIYCIPKLDEIEHYCAFSSVYDAAFEYNEFFAPQVLDDSVVTERIMKAYTDTGRNLSDDTLHGVFLDICVNSEDPMIYKVSDFRVHQSMNIAQKMGLCAVIFHTNFIVNFRLHSYEENWVKRNEEYWSQILDEYPDLNIYIENMFDDSPRLLSELAARLQNHPRFGVCLDIAHANISGTVLDSWYKNISPFVKHLHINDNDGREDLHLPVGSGITDWQQFNIWCQSLNKPLSTLIEVRTYEQLMFSVEYMKKNNIYPF